MNLPERLMDWRTCLIYHLSPRPYLELHSRPSDESPYQEFYYNHILVDALPYGKATQLQPIAEPSLLLQIHAGRDIPAQVNAYLFLDKEKKIIQPMYIEPCEYLMLKDLYLLKRMNGLGK